LEGVHVNRPAFAPLLGLAVLAGLGGCYLDRLTGGGIETGNPQVVDGGGIETGNAGVVAGRIVDGSGAPVRHSPVTLSEVVLTPGGIASPRMYSVLTDSTGAYAFHDIPWGRFALYAPGRGETRMAALHSRIRHGSEQALLADLATSSVVRIQGRVIPAPGRGLGGILACIPGTHQCVAPGPDSVYTIGEAPQGTYELVFLDGGSAHYLGMEIKAGGFGTIHLRDVALGDSVPGSRVPYAFYDAEGIHGSRSVMPVEYPVGAEPSWYADKDFGSVGYTLLNDGRLDKVVAMDYLDQWPKRKEIAGEALAGGPDLAAPLAGFPVPVRLAAPDFDFGQALPDGRDLVVSDGKGRLLPHEIERWDAAAGKAEIWVRLDTLAARRDDRKIVLHWGRPEAFPMAGGAGVFRAENGFLGVWHLADRTGDNRVLDSRGRFHGFATPSMRPEWMDSVRAGEAVIAGGHRPGMSGTYIHVPHQPGLDEGTAFTISVWARSMHPMPRGEQTIASKSGPGEHEWRFRILHDGTLDLDFGNADGWPQGSFNTFAKVPNPEQWHHYAATFENGLIHMYIDGRRVDSWLKQGSVPNAVNRHGADLRIGGDGEPTRNWEGSLDEATYYHVAKPAEWIAMLFHSQRPR
jgi:hypothetical protein